MVSINTNLSSLLVQNNLAQSTNGLSKAIERLTTGYKINHASDNAAGYSIVQNMTSKISSYSVAEENASMGLDLLQTANGSMDLIQEHLVRIRNLAEQAANGTYGAQSLQAIQSEVDARMAEINRIVGNTEYNGIQLFNNAISSSSSSVVTNSYSDFILNPTTHSQSEVDALEHVSELSSFTAGEEYQVSTKEDLVKLAELVNDGNDTTDVTFVMGADIDLSSINNWTPIGHYTGETTSFFGTFDGNGHTISNLTINNESGSDVGLFGYAEIGSVIKNLSIKNVNITGDSSVGSIVGYGDGTISNCYALNGTVTGNMFVGGLLGCGMNIENSYSNLTVIGNDDIIGGLSGSCDSIINSYSSGNVSSNNSGTSGVAGLAYSVRNLSNSYSTGVVTGTGNCQVSGTYVNKYSGGNIENVYYTGTVENATHGTENKITEEELEELIANSTLKRAVAPEVEPVVKPLNFQVGIFGDESSQIALDTSYSFNLAVDVSSHESAISALAAIDTQLSLVSEKQTSFGAAQNRLESVLESISTACENLVSSRSTIQDADVAKESSEYIKKQILQQASATLLATANQSPSIALQLL